MLSVVNQPFMLSVIILNAIMLSVVAPQKILCNSVVFVSGKMLLLSNIFLWKIVITIHHRLWCLDMNKLK
jgi:hypothetical protein